MARHPGDRGQRLKLARLFDAQGQDSGRPSRTVLTEGWKNRRRTKFFREVQRARAGELRVGSIDHQLRILREQLTRSTELLKTAKGHDQKLKLEQAITTATINIKSLSEKRAAAGKLLNRAVPGEAQRFALAAKNEAATGFRGKGFAYDSVDFKDRAHWYSGRRRGIKTEKNNVDVLTMRCISSSDILNKNKDAVLQILGKLRIKAGPGKGSTKKLENAVRKYLERQGHKDALASFERGESIVFDERKGWMSKQRKTDLQTRKNLVRQRRTIVKQLDKDCGGILQLYHFLRNEKASGRPISELRKQGIITQIDHFIEQVNHLERHKNLSAEKAAGYRNAMPNLSLI